MERVWNCALCDTELVQDYLQFLMRCPTCTENKEPWMTVVRKEELYYNGQEKMLDKLTQSIFTGHNTKDKWDVYES